MLDKFSIIIILEVDYFAVFEHRDNYLHDMIKLSGGLRHCVQTELEKKKKSKMHY